MTALGASSSRGHEPGKLQDSDVRRDDPFEELAMSMTMDRFDTLIAASEFTRVVDAAHGRVAAECHPSKWPPEEQHFRSSRLRRMKAAA